MVVRESVTQGHRTGSWTALGVGCGIFLHVAYSLLGIGLIVSQSIVLFNLFKWLAAAYLLYLGWRALRARPQALTAEVTAAGGPARSAGSAFVMGFVTNGLIPRPRCSSCRYSRAVIDAPYAAAGAGRLTVAYPAIATICSASCWWALAVQPGPRARWLCAHGALVRPRHRSGADRPRRHGWRSAKLAEAPWPLDGKILTLELIFAPLATLSSAPTTPRKRMPSCCRPA